MPATEVQIQGLSQLLDNFRRFPEITKVRLQDAVAAGGAEVQKNATRENVPWRTGNLVQSFGNGITIGELFARIAPTAYYAVDVHEGTAHIKHPNRFMPRIAAIAEPNIQGHFARALELIAEEITRL